MAEIDPVVLQLRADVSQHERELRGSTRTVDKEFGYQEARVRRLEQQFKQSSGAIGSTFKGLAATIAAGFGAREVTNLVDGFTRLQNSLKVAGLEGERLAQVQERLFQLGSQYGVSVNTLADLYGNVAQAGKSLGASQTDLLEVTEAVSQSLLITGKSAAEASGATLGLVQALAAGTVRAEEYAQINEGGLRPLLEAAAASERFKGDINALRAAVYDGTVSSREFYQAILDGTNIVAGKASGATITLSGAFQALNDQLGKYLGEAGAASGATGAVAEAIRRLADNLDIIIPALATIATVMGTRMMAQTNSALRSTARSADEVAEYELRNVELARIRTAASVKADQDYSDAQKEEILGLVERVAFVEREAVEFQKRARLEQESAELAEARYRASFESLQLQYELADTDAERQAIAVRILEAEDAFLRSKLEAVAANQTLADAERQQARIALAALNATAAQRREATIRNNETPVQRYLRGVNKTPEQINEALDNIQLDGLDALNDGLVEAIRGTRSLGDTFSSIADQIVADLLRIAVQRAIIAPLADALFPEGGATGGVFSGLFRGLFGRASGGRVEGGQIYRINEGGAPGRVEAFRPDTGGNIIPLGQMGALQASGGKALSGVVRIVIEEEPGFVARVRTEASGAAVQVVRAAAPGMLGAASAQARRDAARPAMPGGMTG